MSSSTDFCQATKSSKAIPSSPVTCIIWIDGVPAAQQLLHFTYVADPLRTHVLREPALELGDVSRPRDQRIDGWVASLVRAI
jgi:hypothetical protein